MSQPPTPVTVSTPTPAPARQPRRAPPAVTFLDAPLSARLGQRVTLQAQAEPNTECSIQIGYAGAPVLGTATSDSSGGVSWTWRVSGRAPTGTWPITVACGSRTGSTSLILS